MIKQSLTLGWLAICNAALAVVTPWFIVTRLGVGVETDAFFASSAIPQVIFLILSSSLMNVLVPMLATENGGDFARKAMGFVLAITSIFTSLGLILYVSAGFWVPRLFPGFSAEGLALTVRLSRIQLISMVLNALIIVLWSTYHARQKFIWAELSPIAANLIALAFLIVALPRVGIIAAAWTSVLNNGLKSMFLLALLGCWARPAIDSATLKECRRRIRPFIFTQTYLRTDPLIDRYLTSTMAAGNLSLLFIGQQAYSAINQITNKALAAPVVPRLALAARNDDWSEYKRLYRERLYWMCAVALASLPVLLLVGERLLHVLIGHGGITAENVRTLWWIMLALWGMLVAGTVGQVTAVAFYAIGDTKTPARLYFYTFLFYLPAKVYVFMRFGLVGLAITTSSYLIVNFVLQLVLLERVEGTPNYLHSAMGRVQGAGEP